MIPPHQGDGLLPPGIHHGNWPELQERFGSTPWRKKLLRGLYRAAQSLRLAGCRRLYVDGSFVTTKPNPEDFDACWEAGDVNLDLLDPVLMTFDNGRAAQKAKYLGELFPSSIQADASHSTFLQFFQRTREDVPKGIVALDLGSLP